MGNPRRCAWAKDARHGAAVLLCSFLAGLRPEIGFWLGPLGWHDANGALPAGLGPPLPRAQIFTGVFAADPFRRRQNIFAALRAHGVAGIVNPPSVSLLDGSFPTTLEGFSLGLAGELELLRGARAAGLRLRPACTSPAPRGRRWSMARRR